MVEPVLRWVGGKRRLLAKLLPLVPSAYRNYYEPFLGSGAMFFALNPRLAYLSDANPRLIRFYQALRGSPSDVLAWLGRLTAEPATERMYYERRASFNAGEGTPDCQAALFYWLNQTCFNGLWRVNGKGEMNVPWGQRQCAVDVPKLMAAGRRLTRAALRCGGFDLEAASEGDFVFLDPPYAGETFTSYCADGWTGQSLLTLRKQWAEASLRGAKLMMTNADVPVVRELFASCNITEIDAPRAVNPRAKRSAKELVIRNYE